MHCKDIPWNIFKATCHSLTAGLPLKVMGLILVNPKHHFENLPHSDSLMLLIDHKFLDNILRQKGLVLTGNQ